MHRVAWISAIICLLLEITLQQYLSTAAAFQHLWDILFSSAFTSSLADIFSDFYLSFWSHSPWFRLAIYLFNISTTSLMQSDHFSRCSKFSRLSYFQLFLSVSQFLRSKFSRLSYFQLFLSVLNFYAEYQYWLSFSPRTNWLSNTNFLTSYPAKHADCVRIGQWKAVFSTSWLKPQGPIAVFPLFAFSISPFGDPAKLFYLYFRSFFNGWIELGLGN